MAGRNIPFPGSTENTQIGEHTEEQLARELSETLLQLVRKAVSRVVPSMELLRALGSVENHTAAPSPSSGVGMPLAPKTLFKRKEAAAMMSISVSTLQELIAQGQIRDTRIGRKSLIHRAEMVRWAEKGSPASIWKQDINGKTVRSRRAEVANRKEDPSTHSSESVVEKPPRPPVQGVGMPLAPKTFFTRKEAAAMMSISVSTLQELIAQGQIRDTRIGRKSLIHRTEMERWAKRARRRAKPRNAPATVFRKFRRGRPPQNCAGAAVPMRERLARRENGNVSRNIAKV